MSLDEVIVPLVALVAAPLAAVVTWRLSRRKEIAETGNTMTTSANTAVATMLVVMNELRTENEDLREEVFALTERLEEMLADLNRLEATIQLMRGKPSVGRRAADGLEYP